jgi:hypothetical protein
MTTEQMKIFIQALQFGFATGATSRFDCLRSFIQSYPERGHEAVAAAAAFERGCCYCPEQEFKLAAMSDQEFAAWMVSFERVAAPATR